MRSSFVAIMLADLIPEAVKAVAGLSLTVFIVIAFAVSSLAALLSGGTAETASISSRPVSTPSVAGDDVVALAYAQLGMPYVWGGASPQTSFDCSGLVQWVYRQVGVNMPRTAQMQYNATTRLSPDELQPGDLVFFAYTFPWPEPITHVGIYIGNGRMINAPTTGDVVRVMSLSDSYWQSHYAGAGRVRR